MKENELIRGSLKDTYVLCLIEMNCLYILVCKRAFLVDLLL
jgi:hypothetical protein